MKRTSWSNSNTKKKSMSQLNNMFKTSSERCEKIGWVILQKRTKKKEKTSSSLLLKRQSSFYWWIGSLFRCFAKAFLKRLLLYFRNGVFSFHIPLVQGEILVFCFCWLKGETILKTLKRNISSSYWSVSINFVVDHSLCAKKLFRLEGEEKQRKISYFWTKYMYPVSPCATVAQWIRHRPPSW